MAGGTCTECGHFEIDHYGTVPLVGGGYSELLGCVVNDCPCMEWEFGYPDTDPAT